MHFFIQTEERFKNHFISCQVFHCLLTFRGSKPLSLSELKSQQYLSVQIRLYHCWTSKQCKRWLRVQTLFNISKIVTLLRDHLWPFHFISCQVFHSGVQNLYLSVNLRVNNISPYGSDCTIVGHKHNVRDGYGYKQYLIFLKS